MPVWDRIFVSGVGTFAGLFIQQGEYCFAGVDCWWKCQFLLSKTDDTWHTKVKYLILINPKFAMLMEIANK